MVTINSGAFPLMRNIDVTYQPNRAKIYSEWLRMFSDELPEALDNLADVIEDVLSYELWKDNYLDTPEEFFERFGIFGLNLEEPAKLIKELRKKRSQKKTEMFKRAKRAKELRDQGMTVQQIGDILGKDKSTISRDLNSCKNRIATPEMQQRKWVGYSITNYTTPETAALKIREKFGDEFAAELANFLIKK